MSEWQAFRRGPRHPIVTCSGCGSRAVNEWNSLKRQRWEESVTTPRRYRCGFCSTPIHEEPSK